jgi:pantothenate kinase
MTVPQLHTFPAAIAAARALVRPDRPAVLGVCGAPGAGKTTVVQALVATLAAAPPPGAGAEWVAHVPMDGFHLADIELDRLGRRSRKGAPDTFDADGYGALLRRLAAPDRTHVTYAPAFERTIEQPIAGSIPVDPRCRLVITEGNYLLHDAPAWTGIRGAFDEIWFATVDDDLRRQRLVERHIRFGKSDTEAREWVARVDEPNAHTILSGIGRADRVIDVSVVPQPHSL